MIFIFSFSVSFHPTNSYSLFSHSVAEGNTKHPSRVSDFGMLEQSVGRNLEAAADFIRSKLSFDPTLCKFVQIVNCFTFCFR